MDPFQLLVDALSSYGLPGIIATVLILLVIYVAKRSGLVATADQARIANLTLNAVVFGLTNPHAEGALLAILSAVLASLLHALLERVPQLKPITAIKGAEVG